jgi:hypothetical protein
VGHGCINYGIKEARCGFVSEDDEMEELDFEDLSEKELRELEDEYGILDPDAVDQPISKTTTTATTTTTSKPVKSTTTSIQDPTLTTTVEE